MTARDCLSQSNLHICDTICSSGRMHHLAGKCRYYGEQIRNGEITQKHAANVFRKILSEDFGIAM